ncbi:GAF domain-containing protein [Vogesella mureinivorans]|uniref:GAF domain-containing protein n=1 Tax=Vogesella mureinivorans TaxID=657276 RepID=UPI0011C74CA1|nr:GAF domain-containing protein [Vogesella mureinivorans]
MPQAYLDAVGLALPAAAVTHATGRLAAALPGLPLAAPADVYRYRVPKLGEGGSCSLVDELDDTPYNVAPWLGGESAAASAALLQLHALVEATLQSAAADWLGVYCRFERDGQARLVKLAYRGLPSRGEFPLTEDFALFSNNSRVGLSGRAAIVADVAAWQAAGGAYYECDPKVQSEVCLPVLAADGSVVGILDAEDARPGFFGEAEQAALAALALALSAPFSQLGGAVEKS